MSEKQENERKRDVLESYKRQKEKCRGIAKKIVSLRDNTMYRSIVYTDTPRGTCTRKDMSDYAEKLDLLQRELEEEREKMFCLKRDLIKYIETLGDERLEATLKKRYIELKGWQQIAHEIGYSDDHVRGYLHRTALKKLKQYRGLCG